jgi:hypothetical protein
MAALDHRQMLDMTVIALELIKCSREYELKQILTLGSDSMSLVEILKFQTPLQPVLNILSVISVTMESP